MDYFKKMTVQMRTYLCAVLCSALGLGLSDQVFANFFKDAYQVTTIQRSIIEGPRELPGILCVFITAALSFLGDSTIIVFAQLLMFLGITVLGLVTPPFGVMLIFLFINSLGMHLAMPLQDSIGMALAERDRVGTRMGQYNGFRTAATMVISLLVFIGFRAGFFTFETQIKPIFLIAAVLFAASFVFYAIFHRQTGIQRVQKRRVQLIFRKRYSIYYMLAAAHGVQKQIVFVYAPWILIELMLRRADTTAILAVCTSFIGVLFLPMVGRWMDRFGVKKLLYAETIGFVCIYLGYFFLSGGVASGRLAITGLPLIFACGLYILDRMCSSLGMVRTVYLRSVTPDPAEVTPALSTGLSIDHVVSIICAYLGGLVWTNWGPQYVFLIALILSAINLFVIRLVRIPAQEETSAAV